MTTLPPLPPGLPDSLLRYLQAIERLITSQRIIEGSGYGIDQRVRGTALLLPKAKAGGSPESSQVTQYKVTAVKGDYLHCLRLNGSQTSGDTVFVAKPWELRKTPFHNQSIVFTEEISALVTATLTITYDYQSATWRTAEITRGGFSGGSATEQQVIIPRYIPGETIIYAADVQETLSGVVLEGSDEGTVSKVELSARMWAKVF